MELLSQREIWGMWYLALEGATGDGWPESLSWRNFGSDQESEKYGMASMAPVMREWIGGRAGKRLYTNEIEVVNRTFEATLEDRVKAFRRDKTGQIRMRIAEMARRSNTHWKSLLSFLIEVGTITQCYDGKMFFAKDHQENRSEVHANLLDSGEYPELAVVDPTRPTVYEMNEAIHAIISHFASFTDDQGEPMNEDATDFLVMVPQTMLKSARAAVASAVISNPTGGAVSNSLNSDDEFSVTVIPNARFRGASQSNKIRVFRTDSMMKPFIMQQETENLQIQSVAEGSELEFNEDLHRHGIKAERNVGFAVWQMAIEASLSAAA